MPGDDHTGEVSRVASAARASDRPVVLIDGRSGSGKTELGLAVASALGAQLIRLDDLYPGWDGLEQGSVAVAAEVLVARRWRRWDWASSAYAEEHRVDAAAPVVIEGSGSLSLANRSLATLGVWVELDAARRKRRALARDGELYAPHWDDWARQEQDFYDRERPDLLADLIVDGSRILD
ncbi:MAG TPA: ATP-binding protein [Galbitalea sp.]|nr:ATP-binding protein [Galbitalea sp.]